MALSTALTRRLRCNTGDEPLAKRLKLAENVLYSIDLPIVQKEDNIFSWLCSELSNENSTNIWITIYRCLAIEPKNFSRLSPETKDLLIEKLIKTLNEYLQCEALEEKLKCCTYIFSNANIYNFSKGNKYIYLMRALIILTTKLLDFNNLKESNKLIKTDCAIECTEHAISIFTQFCRQQFSEKRTLMITFVEELLFPLAFLLDIINRNKISTKIILETEKCIKRLLLNSVKNITNLDYKNDKTEEIEVLFDTLKTRVNSIKPDYANAGLSCIFQFTVATFQHNSVLIDIVLRKLIECCERKELRKQVIISLIENSTDVSYNYDNEIEGITLKSYLKSQIEVILLKKKSLKHLDYDLLSAIAKLNPVIVEDVTQNILEKVFFENKISEKEEIAYDNLIKELWKASVRLRRHHKFFSKFLLTISAYEKKEIEHFKFDLLQNFFTEFSKDLRSRTTSAQILAIFHTLIFHLKSDCINKFKTSDSTMQVCLMTKVVANFFTLFFEYSNFLDNSLPHDWQIKFHQTFIDFRNCLSLFALSICEAFDEHKIISFIAFTDMVKIWCEAYDLLHYYSPNVVCDELDFPVNELQLKKFKENIKKYRVQSCEEYLSQLLLFKWVIYNRDNQQFLKEKIIPQLWPTILEKHFEIIRFFDETKILKMTLHLVNEASSADDVLMKWVSILKRNNSRMTKTFATAVAFQILSNIIKDIDLCSSKIIMEKVDFEKVLQSLNNSETLSEVLKGANEEIFKQNFKLLDAVHADKMKINLKFLSNLPLSFFDTNIRAFLFMVIYTFEEETKNIINLKEFTKNLYLDCLRQNDINVLNNVSNSTIFINHFKEYHTVLLKIFKLSLNSLTALTFWEDFINKDEFNRKINSILLTCVDSSRSKATSNEHKCILYNLSTKLSKKISKKLCEEISDSDEIAGLRVSLKTIITQKKKIKDNMKQCVESTLKKIIQDAETLIDNKIIQEGLSLSLTALTFREHFNIDEEVIKKLCVLLINNPDGKIFSHYLQVLKDNEFQFFAKSLCNQTKNSLVNGNIQSLEKITIIWESLSKAETKTIRSKLLCSSLNNLFNDLLSSEINEISFVFLLKIYRSLVTSKRMIKLSEKIVDSIFVTSNECLNKLSTNKKLSVCQEALGLCLDFLRSKNDFVLDRLPILNALFRKIVQIILQEGKETSFSEEQIYRILAVDIEKFSSFFAKLKKDVARISPYLIADLIKMSLHAGVLPSYLKLSIDTSLAYLLSNCDRHAISFLSRSLPTTTQQIFKTIYDNYLKYHKFTGKI